MSDVGDRANQEELNVLDNLPEELLDPENTKELGKAFDRILGNEYHSPHRLVKVDINALTERNTSQSLDKETHVDIETSPSTYVTIEETAESIRKTFKTSSVETQGLTETSTAVVPAPAAVVPAPAAVVVPAPAAVVPAPAAVVPAPAAVVPAPVPIDNADGPTRFARIKEHFENMLDSGNNRAQAAPTQEPALQAMADLDLDDLVEISEAPRAGTQQPLQAMADLGLDADFAMQQGFAGLSETTQDQTALLRGHLGQMAMADVVQDGNGIPGLEDSTTGDIHHHDAQQSAVDIHYVEPTHMEPVTTDSTDSVF